MKATIDQVTLNLIHHVYTMYISFNGNQTRLTISHDEATMIIDEMSGCEIKVSEDRLMVYYIAKG